MHNFKQAPTQIDQIQVDTHPFLNDFSRLNDDMGAPKSVSGLCEADT